MITIDLVRQNRLNIRSFICEKIGFPEKTTFGFALTPGVTGVFFEDRVGDHIVTYKVAVEVYPQGLALFFRSASNNFLIILRYEEIEQISFIKEEDVLYDFSFSWFKAIYRFGVPYDKAKKFVLEKEKFKVHPASLQITTNQKVTFLFNGPSLNYEKVETFFDKIPSTVNIYKDYKKFRLI